MQSLFDDLIALEHEADGMVESARIEAQKLKSAADEELRRYIEELRQERGHRLKEKEKEAKELFQRSAATEEKRAREAGVAIESIPKDRIYSQVEHILSRLREH